TRLVELLQRGVQEPLEEGRLPVPLDHRAPFRLLLAQALAQFQDGGRGLQVGAPLTNSGELGLKHFDAGIERFEPFAAALDLRLPFLPASRGQGLTDPLRLLASTEPLDEGGLDLGQRPLDLLALPLPLEAFEKVVHLGGARLLQAASALGPGCLHRGPVSIELTLDLLEALLELGEPVCPPGLLPHPLDRKSVVSGRSADLG